MAYSKVTGQASRGVRSGARRTGVKVGKWRLAARSIVAAVTVGLGGVVVLGVGGLASAAPPTVVTTFAELTDAFEAKGPP
jgi:hypothetical protein